MSLSTNCAMASPWSEAKPPCGFSIILWNTAAQLIHETKVELRLAVPPVGGQPQPPNSLHQVHANANAEAIHHAEFGLRASIPLLGDQPQRFHLLGFCSIGRRLVVVLVCGQRHTKPSDDKQSKECRTGNRYGSIMRGETRVRLQRHREETLKYNCWLDLAPIRLTVPSRNLTRIHTPTPYERVRWPVI